MKPFSKSSIAVITLAALLSHALAADPGKPPVIAEVHTWGDLLSQKPVTLSGTGVKLDAPPAYRIGIDGTVGKLYGGVVLYCLAEHDAVFDDKDALGPFRVVVEEPGVKRERAVVKVSYGHSASKDAKAFLYAKVIPLSRSGTYTVTIQEVLNVDMKDPTYRTVAVATITVSKEQADLWSPMDLSDNEPKDAKAADDNSRLLRLYVAPTAKGAALPASLGGQAFVLKDLPDAKLPLPQLFPPAPAPGFHLSVKGNRLVLTFDANTMLEPQPEDNYLVRWWINGKPFLPDVYITEAMASCCGGLEAAGRELDFPLEFHPELLHAKKGDTIAVQMLHCPRGWSYLGPDAMGEAADTDTREAPFFARLSKRVEFTYTGDPASMAQP